MTELRLGDVIDDFCIKCRRITNHSIVSIVNEEAAKVRCRTCYNDHDYRHEQAPPSKKDLKKAELDSLAAAAAPTGETAVAAEEEVETVEAESAPVAAAPVNDKKKPRKTAKK